MCGSMNSLVPCAPDADDIAVTKAAALLALGYEVKLVVRQDGQGRWVDIQAVPKGNRATEAGSG